MRAWLLLLATACSRGGGSEPEPERAPLLAKLPAASTLVFAADGRILAHPRFHPIVDVLRPEVPASLDCLVDIALGSERIAIALTRDHGITVVVDTHQPVQCHALSRVDGLWIATLGGTVATDADSVLATPELDRARPYLATAPLALVAATPVGDVLVTAQPEPFDAWLALDTTEALASAAEQTLRSRIAQLAQDPTTAPFEKKIAVRREGTQIVATLAEVPADLALAVKTLVRTRHPPKPPAFACPGGAGAVRCSGGGTRFEARLAPIFEQLRAARVVPQVIAGDVAGMRLAAAVPPLGLVAGDVIAGIAGRTVTSREAFVAALAKPRPLTLVVRRGTSEAQFSLSELAP